MHATLPACEVHTFDHTMGNRSFKIPRHVHFHHWGIGAEDSSSSTSDDPGSDRGGEHAPSSHSRGVFTLATIRRRLGHTHRPIEVLKMDIEGFEYSTVLPLVASSGGAFDGVRQLLIELIHQGDAGGNFHKGDVFIRNIVEVLHE